MEKSKEIREKLKQKYDHDDDDDDDGGDGDGDGGIIRSNFRNVKLICNAKC